VSAFLSKVCNDQNQENIFQLLIILWSPKSIQAQKCLVNKEVARYNHEICMVRNFIALEFFLHRYVSRKMYIYKRPLAPTFIESYLLFLSKASNTSSPLEDDAVQPVNKLF